MILIENRKVDLSSNKSRKRDPKLQEAVPMLEKSPDKKHKSINYDQLFLGISFIGLVIEAASSIFNLVSTHVFVSERIKRIVAIAFYVTCTIVTVAMIINSALAIKESINKQKISQDSSETSDRKNTDESIKHNKLAKTQTNLQVSENSLTIVSQLMWIIVSIASLIMLSMGGNPTLEQLSLLLSVTAPFLGVVSCVLRLLDAGISCKIGNSEKEKRRSRNFTILCAVILVFEAVHCICHILEAVSLSGRMQDLYSFQDTAVLCLELITVLAFIAAFLIEKYIDSKAEKSQTSDSGINTPLLGGLDDVCAVCAVCAEQLIASERSLSVT
ncbi:hypothetical protein [Ehrlichia japonica]|uniref:Putative membrane protein n=1 Tax=Ehrlichia japonica TaxID=391036 RepID=X5GIH2_9RICK|nr:hypothetical protein [Ehrlichia japonica]AHX04243.1 putative membrane protein [Ehrlichia japonica]